MYNPSDVGQKGTLFGLPYTPENADLILIPVHLDVTVSYREGTSRSPDVILDESSQLDLSLPLVDQPWSLKMVLDDRLVEEKSHETIRRKAKKIIEHLERGETPDEREQEEVNQFCRSVHEQVEERCSQYLNQGKWIGIIGGEHSSPLGLIRSLARRQNFGILQIDAHMDLRAGYEGFDYSHASIMFHALQADGVDRLTQVGIRDYSEEEESYISSSQKNIEVFYDEILFSQKMEGKTWGQQVKQIISTLPERVYISFDIDGLEPALCPNTGTPVPGGLTFQEALYLLDQLVRSGKKIIGFDVCEVGHGQWDANVGARVIYRLAAAMGVSQGLLKSARLRNINDKN